MDLILLLMKLRDLLVTEILCGTLICKLPLGMGVFERCMKLVKACLRKILGTAKLSWDEMLTVLAEVEVVLNNCPLTYVFAEETECCLTPDHLLFGRTLELEASCDERSCEHSNLTLTKRSKFLNILLEHFWSRWRTVCYIIARVPQLHGLKL